MIKYFSIAVALVSIVLIATAIVVIDQGHDNRLENQVYLNVLGLVGTGSDFDSKIIVSRPAACLLDESILDLMPDDMRMDYLDKNKNRDAIIRLSALEGKYNVLTWDTAQEFKGKESVIIAARYPEKQPLYLSRVGFNTEHTKAVLCVNYLRGHTLDMYELKDEKWLHVTALSQTVE
ncbi:MAG: hypothetical protein B6D77_17890 [gamma proteobacterium symbiont of Ctena orbiculata]|nr:MAG: hypothetical protein B6D77_17890 [gamma proteobacterium symbiont of Ctena orbiculata]PVV17306.1 MAG: hypothetical protein B6D78_18985 [gamma proteobacterium symbiont of Ctena orbiculata]